MALKTKYSPLQHFSLDNLLTSFGDLSPRNKMLAIGIVISMVVLIFFLPLSLVSGKVNGLKREISTAQKGYSQVLDKLVDYQRTREEIAALENRYSGGGGSLTVRVEGIAKQSGLNVDQMNEKAPQETDFLEINSIEVRLSNVSLGQLMDFLYNVENDKNAPMKVRRLQIKPKSQNRQLLDVTCEVAVFALKKEV